MLVYALIVTVGHLSMEEVSRYSTRHGGSPRDLT